MAGGMSGIVELFIELLEPLGPVRPRKMFGGTGLYVDDVMFALEADEVIYLKVADRNRPDFEAAGSAPFSYQGKDGQNVIMSYWYLPEHLLDEPDELLVWARKALEIARSSKTKARARKKKKK